MFRTTDRNRQRATATPTIVVAGCVTKALCSTEIHRLYSHAPFRTELYIVDFVSPCQSDPDGVAGQYECGTRILRVIGRDARATLETDPLPGREGPFPLVRARLIRPFPLV